MRGGAIEADSIDQSGLLRSKCRRKKSGKQPILANPEPVLKSNRNESGMQQECSRNAAEITIQIADLIIGVSLLPVVFGGFQQHVFAQSSMYSILGLLALLLIFDIAFQVASIIGLHKKSYNTLRAFFYYEVFALVSDFVLIPVILYTINNEYRKVDVKQTVIIIIVGAFYILIDIFIIAKVKREIMKIHNKYDLSNVQD